MQISPGIAHSPSRLCLSDLRRSVLYKYRALMIRDISPGYAASYPLPVRQRTKKSAPNGCSNGLLLVRARPYPTLLSALLLRWSFAKCSCHQSIAGAAGGATRTGEPDGFTRTQANPWKTPKIPLLAPATRRSCACRSRWVVLTPALACGASWVQPTQGAASYGTGSSKYGRKQASTTCRSLSLAKSTTKWKASGSSSRKAVLTTTAFAPLTTVGRTYGENFKCASRAPTSGLKHDMTPHKRSAQSLGRNRLPLLVVPRMKNSVACTILFLANSAIGGVWIPKGVDDPGSNSGLANHFYDS